MKLKNKQTGEIAEFIVHKRVEDSEDGNKVYAQVVINPDEWEDYEEPKHDYYFIRDGGNIDCHWYQKLGEITERRKEIGNYFETKKEAEKAVEKLKAWKRLKDKGFEFVGLSYSSSNEVYFEFVNEPLSKEQAIEAEKDLDLLFSGEDD